MPTFNDFSQLKHLKPAEPKEPPKPVISVQTDRKLEESQNSAEYFSSLLGARSNSGSNNSRSNGKSNGAARASSPVIQEPRPTRVTAKNMSAVRREQQNAVIENERKKYELIISDMQDELEAQQECFTERIVEIESSFDTEREQWSAERAQIETDHNAALEEVKTQHVQECKALEKKQNAATKEYEKTISTLDKNYNKTNTAKISLEQENEALKEKIKDLNEQLAKTQKENNPSAEMQMQLDWYKREVTRLQTLIDGQGVNYSASPLLEKPVGLSEKFVGEIREHIIAVLKEAYNTAEQCGRERRGRILEAVLGTNADSGELEARRARVRQIVKSADSCMNDSVIKGLEDLGFRYVSGNKHHKLEWAGIRFPISKTPSDVRANLNLATDICNRVF